MKIVNVLVTFLLFAVLLLLAYMFAASFLGLIGGEDWGWTDQVGYALMFQGLFFMVALFAILIILIRRK